MRIPHINRDVLVSHQLLVVLLAHGCREEQRVE